MDTPEDVNWLDSAVVPTVLQILLCGYVIVIIASSFARPVDKFDDASVLVNAMLVQQGRTPNLDFFSYYPPLGIYLHAVQFDLLGRTALASHTIGAFFFLLLLALLWMFFRSRFPRRSVLVPAALLLIAA